MALFASVSGEKDEECPFCRKIMQQKMIFYKMTINIKIFRKKQGNKPLFCPRGQVSVYKKHKIAQNNFVFFADCCIEIIKRLCYNMRKLQ